jgi:hypothetical protein
MTWLIAVRPSWSPDVGEFIPVDFPEVIALARTILAADGQEECIAAARQLAARPLWQRGRGCNPNKRSWCGHQADWHTFEGVVRNALYEGLVSIAYGGVKMSTWRAIRDSPRWVWCV